MATLYGKDGVLLGWRRDDAEEAQYPIPADAERLEFDFDANTELISTLRDTDWKRVHFGGGRVLVDETPLHINAGDDA